MAGAKWTRLLEVKSLLDEGLVPGVGVIPDTVWKIRERGELPDGVGQKVGQESAGTVCRIFSDAALISVALVARRLSALREKT